MRIDPTKDRSMMNQLRSRRPRNPWVNLINQILGLTGNIADLIRHTERPWASVTFSGSRHTVLLVFNGEKALDAGEDFIALLPDHEFTIPGQIVADATVVAVTQETLPAPKMTVEADLLLLEDC